MHDWGSRQVLKRSKSEKAEKRHEWEPHGEGVLLVCDDPDAAELLSRLMTADGHDVHRVETAEGAVRHLLATPRRATVLSLSGPTANRQLLEKIRTHPNPPVSEVAVVLMADDVAAGSEAWAKGADGFLARPFHAEQLSAELQGALDRPFADRVAHREAERDTD
jgi:DNA-binding response OmpR family regulator